MSNFDAERVYAEVQEAVERLFEVVASADIVSTMALLADALHADQGMLKTHQELEAAYGVLYESLERVAFDRTHCEIHPLTPEFAYVIAAGSYTSFGRDGSQLSGPIAWTYLWKKGAEGWKLQHMHQSLQQPLPERVFQRPEA